MSFQEKYSYWIKAGKFTALTKFSALGAGVLTFILLARMMGPAMFGVWGILVTVNSITETARLSLIRNGFIRMSQKDNAKAASLQAAALMLSLLISGALAVVFLFGASLLADLLHAPDLRTGIYWLAATLPVTAVFSHIEMNLTAALKFNKVSVMQMTRQLGFAGLVVFCFFLKLPVTLNLLCLFTFLAVLAGLLVGAHAAAPVLQWRLAVQRSELRQLWSFGKFVFGTNLSSLLFRSTDNFMTAAFFSPAIAAYYNASLRISNLVDIPSQVLGDIVYPRASRLNNEDKESICDMYEKAVAASLLFSFPALVLISAFPELILRLLAGAAFVPAAGILRITVFFGFMLPFLKQFGTIMDATGQPQVNFRTMLFAFLINVVGNLLAIRFLGIYGAAVGTAITYTLTSIGVLTLLHRYYGVSFLRVMRRMFNYYRELLAVAGVLGRRPLTAYVK